MLLLEIINTKVYTWIAVLWLLALYVDYKYSPETFRSSLKFVLPSMLVVTTIGWRSRKLKPTRMKGMGVLVLIGTLILAIPWLIWHFLAEAITGLAKKLLGESWSTVTGWLVNIPTRAWLIGVGIIAIPILIYLLSRLFRKRPSRTARSEEEERRSKTIKEWWAEAIVTPITFFVIMIDLILWQVYPTWVWKPVNDDLMFVAFLHLAYCFALTGLATSPKWKARTAMILLVMTILALTTRTLGITPWLGESYWIDRQNKSKTTEDSSFNETNLRRPTSCPDPSVFTKMAQEAWIEALPSIEARRMINAMYRESSNRFCDNNGRIVVNQQNNDAIGAMGLKRSLHEKEAKKLGLNIYDPVDHLKYSVILRKKDGEAPWKESFDYLDKLEVKVETLKAEQGKWTKAMKYGPLCWEEPDGDVLMRDERGEVTPLPAWSEKQPVVYATTASYSTKSSEPVEVLFKCLIE
jgi:hypothetical protein